MQTAQEKLAAEEWDDAIEELGVGRGACLASDEHEEHRDERRAHRGHHHADRGGERAEGVDVPRGDGEATGEDGGGEPQEERGSEPRPHRRAPGATAVSDSGCFRSR